MCNSDIDDKPFFATFALVQISLGVALDRWGPRWVTAGLMTVAVLGSLIFAAGSSFLTLALGRALLGIGMAGILMGGLKAFSHWYPGVAGYYLPQAYTLALGITTTGSILTLLWYLPLIRAQRREVTGSLAWPKYGGKYRCQ